MSLIRPFQGIHYNPKKIKDMTTVVCPPYDVISAEQEDTLKKRSPYNFIHVMLAKDDAKHGADDARFEAASKAKEKFMEEGVLVQDTKPCFYFLKQEYRIMGQKHSRMGFLAAMKIDDESAKVHPHEKTHAGAKEDRFKLWSSLKAACSPIFVCFSDKQKKIDNIFMTKILPTTPFMDVVDDEGTHNQVWKFDDQDSLEEMMAIFKGQNLFIADGHHRFEVSRRYKEMKMKEHPDATGTEPWNYVMTYFTNIDSKGLQIFPIHRIVKKFSADMAFLESMFRVDSVRNREDLVTMLAKAGLNEHAIGLYTKEGAMLLRLKNKMQIDEYIKEGSADFKRLDSLILKNFVFDQLDVQSEDIMYSNKDVQECFRFVDEGVAEAAFILNPVKIDQLSAIALNGEKMPPKTTYFYPKVLSGVAIYSLE